MVVFVLENEGSKFRGYALTCRAVWNCETALSRPSVANAYKPYREERRELLESAQEVGGCS